MGSIPLNNSSTITQSKIGFKHLITFRGVNIVVSTCRPVNTHKLLEYMDRSIKIDGLNITILDELIEKMKNADKKQDTNTLNTCFNAFMDLVTLLIRKYEAEEGDFAEHLHNKSTNSNKMENENYVFKVPKHKETVFDRHWRTHYNELSEFKRIFGHCNVSRTTPGYDQLGNWLSDQRKKLRRGKMTKEQYDMLSDLGVDWDRSKAFVATPFKA